MSTPAAIEIVRTLIEHRKAYHGIGTDEQINAALAAVLRDAERFAALERHVPAVWVRDGIAFLNYAWQVDAGGRRAIKLSELADRLKGTK